MKFAFYDLETTGISPAFDQPLQFAAILTDGEFREIERVNLRCRIAPHIIPSPWALAVTGVRPAQLTDPSLPTLFEFTQEIGALIERWSPSIWTGFNSIRFDEEMLRQAFYQNLQPDVFATQFNGNSRFDVLTALYAVWYRQPDLFDWPVDPDGRVRFKLDRIAPLNGFAAHNAHDALGDVEATIHVARQIAQRAPALWAELLANRDKAHVHSSLATFQPMALVERFGGGLPRATVGCFCGTSPSNPNQAAFFDLDAADPADLLVADAACLFAAVDATPKVIRSVTVNKSPALLFVPTPSAEQLRRAEAIANAPEFRTRVGQALAARFPEDPAAPTPPVEKQIYGGFYSHADKALLAEFQRADWRRRQEIVASLADPRLRQLGRRLVAFHAPELLSAEEQGQYQAWLRERWSAPEGPATEWMTVERSQRAIDEMRTSSHLDVTLTTEIATYLQRFEGSEGEERA
ncbi:exonuclease domain-containing protein [Roseibaca sp. V10]|uniref:Exonuclease domain-containing protein n=1 Tax=Roseinatronobacter domitianus TaxID=2940293 RepID=A0ABT0M4T4_9RHOB|nr:exonuclease domain-containing protein [Roseibaca domitiana]MCL1629876.1 exonuclease domain-containing protein [Roseibaca domitiana]